MREAQRAMGVRPLKASSSGWHGAWLGYESYRHHDIQLSIYFFLRSLVRAAQACCRICCIYY
jgi:hypothetical protein